MTKTLGRINPNNFQGISGRTFLRNAGQIGIPICNNNYLQPFWPVFNKGSETPPKKFSTKTCRNDNGKQLIKPYLIDGTTFASSLAMKFTRSQKREKALNGRGGFSSRGVSKEGSQCGPPSFTAPIPTKPGIPCTKCSFGPQDKTHYCMLPRRPMLSSISI